MLYECITLTLLKEWKLFAYDVKENWHKKGVFHMTKNKYDFSHFIVPTQLNWDVVTTDKMQCVCQPFYESLSSNEGKKIPQYDIMVLRHWNTMWTS